VPVKYSQEVKERALRLRAAGLSAALVAQEVGCSESVVYYWTTPAVAAAIKSRVRERNHRAVTIRWISIHGRRICVLRVPLDVRRNVVAHRSKSWGYLPAIRTQDPEAALDRLGAAIGGGLSLHAGYPEGYYGLEGLGNVKDWCAESVKAWERALEEVCGE
jgi:hypothetical protein